MSEQVAGRVIQVPNTLRAKVGGAFGAIDPSAIAKAEAAMKALSANFAQWLDDEVVKLEDARARLRTEGLTPETSENLYLRAHDLKGLGGTYEFPLVTRIAGSLCTLIETPARMAATALPLIDAHVDAIRAVVRDKIKTDDHPVGLALVTALERQVGAAA